MRASRALALGTGTFGGSTLIVAGALLALGCSDPAPATAQGAANIDVLEAESTVRPDDKRCDVSKLPILLGPGPAPTSTDPGGRDIDGQGAAISCTVSPVGTQFALAGTIRRGFQTFNVNGLVGVDEPGEGSVIILDNPSNRNLRVQASDPKCTLAVDQGNLAVGPGQVWARFDCPGLSNPNSPTTFCAARGVFVFENCLN